MTNISETVTVEDVNMLERCLQRAPNSDVLNTLVVDQLIPMLNLEDGHGFKLNLVRSFLDNPHVTVPMFESVTVDTSFFEGFKEITIYNGATLTKILGHPLVTNRIRLHIMQHANCCTPYIVSKIFTNPTFTDDVDMLTKSVVNKNSVVSSWAKRFLIQHEKFKDYPVEWLEAQFGVSFQKRNNGGRY